MDLGSYRITDPQKPQTRRFTKPRAHQVPHSHGSQVTESHRPPKATDPPNYWITESHHTRTRAGLIGLFPATIWLTIWCLSHRATPVLHPRVTGLPLATEPPSHQPIGLPATMCVLAHPLATKPPSNQTTNHQGHRSATYHPTRHQIHLLTGAKPPKATDHQVPGSRSPDLPDTRPIATPNTRVTGSQACHLPLYHLSSGAKVPRCQGAKATTTKILDHQTPSPPTHPTTEATDPPDSPGLHPQVTEPQTHHLPPDPEPLDPSSYQPIGSPRLWITDHRSHQPTRPPEPHVLMVSKPPTTRYQSH